MCLIWEGTDNFVTGKIRFTALHIHAYGICKWWLTVAWLSSEWCQSHYMIGIFPQVEQGQCLIRYSAMCESFFIEKL